ncbi:MAG: 6,7-dimethyl-8-ribityllumazine synthase, partial [Bacteroidota bacterium]
PIILGVLTVNSQKQALDRANGKYGNKGKECAEAALRMVEVRMN